MLPALNLPTLVSPPCASLCLTFPLQLHSNGTRDIISPWGSFNNTSPFTISLPLPLPLPFPLPVLSCLPFPIPILCSLPLPGPSLTALRVLLTLAVVIVIVITRMALSSARHSGICHVLIIIILVDCLIPIQWSNSQEVVWLVLPAARCLDHCPEIIATIPWETLGGEFNLSRAGCLQIGAIHLIPECTGVVPPPVVHLVAGCVKQLPHVCPEGCSPVLKGWTPAPAVCPDQLKLWKVASCHWIKKDCIIKEVPGPLILDAAGIVYPYKSTDVFRDDSLYTVPIQLQASIYNWCQHFCPSNCLPVSCAAVLGCHRCEFKMNPHPTH